MACPTFFLSAIKCQQAQKYASNINHFIDQCNERFGNDHFAAIWRLQSIKNYEFPKKFAILQIGQFAKKQTRLGTVVDDEHLFELFMTNRKNDTII